jgi:hypothetical protein
VQHIVNSPNSGRWPGSAQPDGLRMWAMLTAVSPVLARPHIRAISFGCSPAAATRLGAPISSGMPAVSPAGRARRDRPRALIRYASV